MLFQHGRLYMTRAINDRVADDEGFSKFILNCLQRHLAGDWGDLCIDDKKANSRSLLDGSRLLSAYKYGDEKVYIITESNRSMTTILYNTEY